MKQANKKSNKPKSPKLSQIKKFNSESQNNENSLKIQVGIRIAQTQHFYPSFCPIYNLSLPTMYALSKLHTLC